MREQNTVFKIYFPRIISYNNVVLLPRCNEYDFGNIVVRQVGQFITHNLIKDLNEDFKCL